MKQEAIADTMVVETTGATGTQADPGTQPPAGESAAQAAADQGETSSPPESISLEEARKLRSEANSLRRRLKDLEDQAKAKADAELSDNERLSKRASELERQLAERDQTLQETRIRSATVEAAARLGFADPEDAMRLLNHASLEFDENGSPTNVEQQLAALAKTKPYLLGRKVPSFDTGSGGSEPAGGRIYTLAELRDPKFFETNREDILKARAEGRIR